MANTIPSPDMNMPVPVVGTDPGPDWANNINACLSIIDQHTHTTGQGVPITPDAININTDLTMNDNNLTTVRSTRFNSQASPIPATGSDLGIIYESGVDLYYNDGAGNQVRITQGGTVTGATGTITGLPSGTASASFSGNTFTFNSATNTPANMAVGPVIIGRNSVSPATVTLTPNVAQASNYSLTFPIALPSTSGLLQIDSSGVSTLLTTQVGSTTTTFSFNGGGGTSSPITLYYQRLGDWITVFSPSVSATSGIGSTSFAANTSLPTWARPLTVSQYLRGPSDIEINSVSTTNVGLVGVTTTGIVFIQRDNVVTAFPNSTNGCGQIEPYTFTFYVGTGS